MNYIVIDLEFNQAFDFPTGQKTKNNHKCQFEIIQIGAIKLNENLTELDRKSFMVKPQIYERMHPFVEKITGISMADLTSEKFFDAVYKDFIDFIGADKSTLCVWGSNDIKVLYRNAVYYKLNHKLMPRRFINVQDLASAFLKHPLHASIGLKAAVEAFRLTEDIDFHNALNDAIYTAEIFKIVQNPDMRTETFNLNLMKQEKEREKLKKAAVSFNLDRLVAFAETELKHKLSAREKKAVVKIYTAGRKNVFDPKFDEREDILP